MSRILTGIQSTGTPHLGNILGAIIPAIEKSINNESYLFIADLHSLTQIKDSNELRENTYSTAAAWLAFGLNTEKTVFYKQSDVAITTELAWILSTYFPYQRLTLAHSFKDKSDNLKDVNVGLFTYPMLMAADILMFNSTHVPVGPDQLQHLEMTRDIANRFNHIFGNTFEIPEAIINDDESIPGIDGRKMSKSYNNVIPLLCDEKTLRKSIMKIVTNSLEPGEPKDHKSCNVFSLYTNFASDEEIAELKEEYNNGISWGDAKNKLFDKANDSLLPIRERYFELKEQKDLVKDHLSDGAKKVRPLAQEFIEEIRSKIGIS